MIPIDIPATGSGLSTVNQGLPILVIESPPPPMSHSAEHPAFIAAGETFAKRLKALEPAADVSRAAVAAALDPTAFDFSDPADAKLIAGSLALALAQLRLLIAPCLLYVSELEAANDLVEAEQVS